MVCYTVLYVLTQVFEYNTVVMEQVAMHYPVTEMLCNSKIR